MSQCAVATRAGVTSYNDRVNSSERRSVKMDAYFSFSATTDPALGCLIA
jgi:hypothetical protein